MEHLLQTRHHARCYTIIFVLTETLRSTNLYHVETQRENLSQDKKIAKFSSKAWLNANMLPFSIVETGHLLESVQLLETEYFTAGFVGENE